MPIEVKVLFARAVAKGDEEGELIMVLQEVGGTRRVGLQLLERIRLEIAAAYFGVSRRRPGVHEAWANTIRQSGIELVKVLIHKIEEGPILHCALGFKTGNRIWTVDAEATDGFALALHLKVPIMFTEEVFETMRTFDDSNAQKNHEEVDEKLHIFEVTHPDVPKA